MPPSHAHLGLVAIRAGESGPDDRREFCSGLLIAPRLVLTARHGVFKDGSPLPAIEVTFITGQRGSVRETGPLPGTVAWTGTDDLDVALIELPGRAGSRQAPASSGPGMISSAVASSSDASSVSSPSGEPAIDFVPRALIWAEPVGTDPVPVTVTGLPGFAAEATGEPAETETVRGALDPRTYTASNRYAVNPDAWPKRWQDWQGISGAAVRCADGGHLLGVTVWSDEAFEGRRLTAVPVWALLADPGFREVLERHLGHIPQAEPAELFSLLSHPGPAGSIGALLRADAGLTEFAGRADELAFLERWRDEPSADGLDFKALLITGRGGEGKTRLALEFLARSKQAGWTGGVIRPDPDPDRNTALTRPARPLLLVIDYAAARTDWIITLVRAITRARPQVPLRLLLLARADGDWWPDLAAELREELPALKDQILPLGPLLTTGTRETDPAALFAATAVALAPRAAGFTDRTPAELRALAGRLPIPPSFGPRSGHALTVQMAALAVLLDAATAETRGAASTTRAVRHPEDALLEHEQSYRDRLATRYNLGPLKRVRNRAVAGAALFGARGTTLPDARNAACTLVAAALAPELDARVAAQRDTAAWIAGLYPPDPPEPGGDTEYWGEVLPDRLGEFLAVRLLTTEETAPGPHGTLLTALAVTSDPVGAARALLILSRSVDHDPQAADWIATVVGTNPMVCGTAALQVAAYAENPEPLRAALIQLGQRDAESLNQAVAAVYGSLPRFSLMAMESSLSITRQLTLVYGELSSLDHDIWQPRYAAGLNNYANRLADVGQREQALAISAMALEASAELIDRNHDAYLPDLAIALGTHANRLAEAGQRKQALEISAMAVTAWQELAGRDADTYLPQVASALANHANRLREVGQREQALEASAMALAARAWLTDHRNRDAYLPDFIASLHAHSVHLAEAGQREQALQVSAKALEARAELANRNRDAYLPDYAKSLDTHANRLGDAGQCEQALQVSAKALEARAELANRNRDAYLPDYATSLQNHAGKLVQVREYDQGLAVSAQALDEYRELVGRNRDAYLPALAGCLNNYASALFLAERHEQALAVSAQALDEYRELVGRNRDAYLPQLADCLNNRALWLSETGHSDQALVPSAEALNAYHELAAGNRPAHLLRLTRGLAMRGRILIKEGQITEGVTSWTAPAILEALSCRHD